MPVNQELQSTQILDYDFSKASLTPSVELDINISIKWMVSCCESDHDNFDGGR